MARKEIMDLVARIQAVESAGGPFTLDDARRAGIDPQRLARATRAGALHRVGAGLYTVTPDRLALARHHIERLADRGVPAAVGSVAAAQSWRVSIFGSTGPIHQTSATILIPRDTGIREGERHGIRIRVADLTDADVTEHDGVPMTRPLRTGLDVARELGRCRASALVPLSSAVRAEIAWDTPTKEPLTDSAVTDLLIAHPEIATGLRESLDAIVSRVNGHGMRWVRRVLGDVEPLLETVLEGLAWTVLTDSDLPRPQPQRWVTGVSGRRYRADFLLGERVILECDGAIKYADQTPWQEKQRQSDLEAAGYWVVRCTWEELLRRPHEVLKRLRLALLRAAA